MVEKKKPSTILSVVSNIQDLNLTTPIMQEHGYVVDFVVGVHSAILKIKSNAYDLIIFDDTFSALDGFEVVRQVKLSPRNQDTPIIILINQREEEERLISLFKLGSVDYVQKPFKPEVLLARVELHLSLKKTQTELENAKNVAEEAAKAKSLFLANMSHEIRTPLNGIVGMIDILRQTKLDKQQQEFLEIIDISSETLMMIINDILDFSKIEAGQISFERIKFNVRHEIDEVYKLLSYRASQKSLEFTVRINENIPELVLGDPLRLKQILINLINNAIKFTEEGSVRLRVTLDKDLVQKCRLRFEVTDTGIGISVENQKKLFKLFSQADSSTTRKFGGTGLGLVISKRLANMMNGEIGVDSEEGKGSLFWFTAIFDKTSAISVVDDLERVNDLNMASPDDSRELNILLAEDNIINQKVSALTIRKLGHQVQLASNGITAVKLFVKNSFDLILMDIQMPGMNGLDATREIRRIENEKGVTDPIPIIAMTANNYKEDIDEFLADGMTDHLGKPFKPAELAGIIEKNVRKKVIT
ncbi:response regulator [Gaoshiqia sp. Z1-71]|uniref:response regulator n=1 Tax=Gaoshiqia hydrogeniformans TaxID=3290090 RepID=UPI003BF7BF22